MPDRQTPDYTIDEAKPSITCTACGMESFHPKDIEKLYCAKCCRFHQPQQACDSKVVR